MMYLLLIFAVVVIGLLVNYLTFTRHKIEIDTSKYENESQIKAAQEFTSPIQNQTNELANDKQVNTSITTSVSLLSNVKSDEGVEKLSGNQASKLRSRGDHRGAYKASRFLSPIRKGYQIFLQNMGVTGLGFRREAAIAFIDDLNQSVRLELEPENIKDKNAIKVVGVGDSGDYFIGYLPKEASLQIVKTNSFEHVYARLVRAYRGTDDYLEIQLQIVGLKEKKQEFDAFAKCLPAKESQKEYFNYWEIPFDESITIGDADLIISEHTERTSDDESAWNEYKLFLNLVDELDDADTQESYGLRSVPRKILISTLNKLKLEFGSYEELADDPEVIVEKILSEHPKLAVS